MIREFCEIGKNDIETVGGKGANLGEMTRAGINVPQGFVVTSNAYKLFLNENNINSEIKYLLGRAGNDEEELFKIAEKIRQKIIEGHFPKEVKDSIEKGYRNMCMGKVEGDVRVAVRSSATAEDLPDASFAGQQETYLNVRGIDLILSKVKDCYASLWGGRAVSYRESQGYNHESVALAVVVQQMIESEKSGVLFTANPVMNNSDEIQINASYGLGESVVSGKVTPDTYICTKDGIIKKTVMGTKSIEVVYSEKGMIKKQEVDEIRQKKACLLSSEIKSICKVGMDIEKHYKMPMDIEWAIFKNKVYILQARPITTINYKDEEKVIEEYIKKNKSSNLFNRSTAFALEKLPVAMFPMDYGLLWAIGKPKTGILSEGGIEISTYPRMDDDGIMVLGSNSIKISKKIFNIISLIRELKNLPYCKNKCENSMVFLHKEVDNISKINFSSLSLEECGEITEKIIKTLKEVAYLRFRYALYPSMLLSKKMESIVKKVDKSLTSFDLYYNLDNKTAVITREISKLAELISNNDNLKDKILCGESYESIYNDFPEIAEKFSDFMRENGMKSDFNCYCLYSKSFKEDPERLLNIIRPLIGNYINFEEDRFGNLMGEIKKIYSENKFKKVKSDIDYFRYFHVIREESQYLWETLYYCERMVIKRAALLCMKDEDYTNNIAYLFLDEFINMAKSGEMSKDIEEKIERRKSKRNLAQKVWEKSKACVFKQNGEVLKGISGSRGEVIGKVCIIKGPEEFYKLKKGDILICPLTDPEWTPLFKVASAVVADTGGALSHAAIIAREYDVPAVLGVGIATSKFKDGDKVCVDGTNGKVFLVK